MCVRAKAEAHYAHSLLRNITQKHTSEDKQTELNLITNYLVGHRLSVIPQTIRYTGPRTEEPGDLLKPAIVTLRNLKGKIKQLEKNDC